MDPKSKIEYEEQLVDYLRKSQVDGYMKLMSERLLNDMPADPIAYLLQFLKNEWNSTTTFVICQEGIVPSDEQLKKVRQKDSKFDYIVCKTDTQNSEIRSFIKSNGGRSAHSFVFNFPRNIQDVQFITDYRLFYNKLICLQERKSTDDVKNIVSQYKEVAVKMTQAELLGHLSVF
jgi:hypothetical protein